LKTPTAIALDHLGTVPIAGLRTCVDSVSPKVLAAIRSASLFVLGFEDVEGMLQQVKVRGALALDS
jgi:hypothetical protein